MKGLIVGFGTMGNTHTRRFHKLGVEVAIVDSDHHARHRAEERGLQAFATLEEAWKHTRYDCIAICTPTYLHAGNIQEALAYHIPLFVEKPVVRTRDEANKLLTLHNPPSLMVGEVEQYNPHLAGFTATDLQPSRVMIERLVNLDYFLHGTKPWFLDEKKSGGIVLDLAIHDLTLLLAKYGVPKVEKVRGTSSGEYGIMDDLEITLHYPQFPVTLHTSWVSTRQQPIHVTIALTKRNGKAVSWNGGNYDIGEIPEEKNDPFLLELTAFLSMINTGIPPYPIKLYCQAVILANTISDLLRSKQQY